MSMPTEQLTPEDLEEIEEWGRRVRREMADWEFIDKLPERLREALVLFIETGDLRLASTRYGINICLLDELRFKARIPLTL